MRMSGSTHLSVRFEYEAHGPSRRVAAWCMPLAFGALVGCGSSSSGRSTGVGPSDAGRDSEADGAAASAEDARGSNLVADAGDAALSVDGVDGGDDGDGACSWTLGSGTPQGTAPTEDNSADLSGATFGVDAFDATQQRRTVPIQVTTPLSDLTLGTAYVTGLAGDDTVAYLILPVTNSGADFPCFVQTTTYNWLSATNATLNQASTLYLDGSVGAVSSTVNTETCLAPGETGYLTDAQFVTSGSLYSAVASIQIQLESMGAGSAPPAKLLPTRYDVGTCGGVRTVQVEGTASGATVSIGNVENADLAPIVFLDADGLPARWSYLTQMTSANVAPGATAYFLDDLSEPAVSRARVFMPFEPQDPSIVSQKLAIRPSRVLGQIQAVRASRRERAQRWQRVQSMRSLSEHAP
jgi:hypothetical protein